MRAAIFLAAVVFCGAAGASEPLYLWKESTTKKVNRLVFKSSDPSNAQMEKMLRAPVESMVCARSSEYLKGLSEQLQQGGSCESVVEALSARSLNFSGRCDDQNVRVSIKKTPQGFAGTNEVVANNEEFDLDAVLYLTVQKVREVKNASIECPKD